MKHTDEKLDTTFNFPFQTNPGRIDFLPPFPLTKTYNEPASETAPARPAFTQPMSSHHRGSVCKACSGEKLIDEAFCHSCFYSLLPAQRNQLRQPIAEWGRAYWEAKRYLAGKHKVEFMSEKQKTIVQGVPQISGAIIMSDGRCLTSETPFKHLMIEYKLMATVDSSGFVDCLIALYPDGSLKIIFRDGLPVTEPVTITFNAGVNQA